MEHIGKSLQKEYKPVSSPYKSERAELIARLTDGLNISREGHFKPLSARFVAVRVNSHPILGHDINELRYLIQRCEEAGNYKQFWYFTKQQ